MFLSSLRVPLGLLFKNENLNDEMIDILDTIHTKYVPSHISVDENGEQTTEVLEQIFFGGDQLTEERARNAKDARGNGDSAFDRLEGVISKVEDWHAIRLAYQVRTSANKPAIDDEGIVTKEQCK